MKSLVFSLGLTFLEIGTLKELQILNTAGCLNGKVKTELFKTVTSLPYKKSTQAVLLLMLRYDEVTRPNFSQLAELLECGVFDLPSYSLVNEAYLANEFSWTPPPRKERRVRQPT
jgi:hypothetical protein